MMSDLLDLSELKHALVAIDLRHGDGAVMVILHVVGYPNAPSEDDIELLYEELSTDEELGMTDLVPFEDYMLVHQPFHAIRDILGLDDYPSGSLH